jgi:hypothetical protein
VFNASSKESTSYEHYGSSSNSIADSYNDGRGFGHFDASTHDTTSLSSGRSSPIGYITLGNRPAQATAVETDRFHAKIQFANILDGGVGSGESGTACQTTDDGLDFIMQMSARIEYMQQLTSQVENVPESTRDCVPPPVKSEQHFVDSTCNRGQNQQEVGSLINGFQTTNDILPMFDETTDLSHLFN